MDLNLPPIGNDEQNSFDLNAYPPTSNGEENSFDLNTSPLRSQIPINEIKSLSEEVNYGNPPSIEEIERSIPITVRSSSPGVLLLDLNINDNQEFESSTLELHVEELIEEEANSPVHDSETFDNSRQEQRVGCTTKKNLSNEKRWAIYNALLEKSSNGKLKHSATNEVSALFLVPIRTVQHIWKRAKETQNGFIVDVSHRKTNNRGRKRIHIGEDEIRNVPLRRRTTLMSLAEALNVKYTTLYRHFKQGLLRRHSSTIKPHLKEENKRARLQFCMSMIDENGFSYEPKFVSMYKVVHIDEKWFYMTKKVETSYLLLAEEDPLRTCKSKNFICKVMFLVAMARPRFDEEGNEAFREK